MRMTLSGMTFQVVQDQVIRRHLAGDHLPKRLRRRHDTAVAKMFTKVAYEQTSYQELIGALLFG